MAPTYQVDIQALVTLSIQTEAETQDEAIDNAKDELFSETEVDGFRLDLDQTQSFTAFEVDED